MPADPVGCGSISAQEISGIASTGAGSVSVQYRAEHVTVVPVQALQAPEGIAAPAGMVNLPLVPRVFVGRERELHLFSAALQAAGPVVVQAWHGLGGIGKSTLAARWADRHRDVFAPIWWITADSSEALDAGLVAFATALQPGLGETLPSSALRERAVLWLASHHGWLLILDNVDRPADIADLLARLPHGRIVVTSRRATGWTGPITPVRLDVLDPVEAVALLTGLLDAAGVVIDEQDAVAVCTELGCLPLAVEQASAYLAQTGVPARDYLRMVNRYPDRLLAEGEEGREAQRTVARVWKVSLDALADEPLPGRLLRVLAWFGPEAVPRSLLDGLAEEPALTTALGRLAAYNMVELDGGSIITHRLVQAVTRSPDPTDPHRRIADITSARTTALTALLTAAPEDWRDPASWPQWRALLPHIDAATRGEAGTRSPDDVRRTRGALLNRAALFVGGQGNAGLSIQWHQAARDDRRQVLGDDHPDTLASVTNLAYALQMAGDLARAIPMHEQALADSRRVLGNDHPCTMLSVNDLAVAFQVAGDLGRAIPLHERALADRRRVLGNDHRDTLIAANNLASAYRAVNDPGRAIPMFEQALADSRRILGDNHLGTLIATNNLAYGYQAAGDLSRAIPMHEQAWADSRRILGDDHPDTLIAANNLASAYQTAGDLDRAIPMFEKAWAGSRRVLGDDHPTTSIMAVNLRGAKSMRKS